MDTHTPVPLDNEVLPLGRAALLGLLHVLVMLTPAVLVPLMVGRALGEPREGVALLVRATLCVSGFATLLQTIGLRRFGVRLPTMVGVTLAAAVPAVILAGVPGVGAGGIFGAVLVAGALGLVIAPFIDWILPFFPPVVYGSTLVVAGLALLRTGIDWAAGGSTVVGAGGRIANPGYGALPGLAMAGISLIIVLIFLHSLKGRLHACAVFLGLAVGFLAACARGEVDLAGSSAVPWVALLPPLPSGPPTFHAGAILAMALVVLITQVESTGMYYALAGMSGKALPRRQISDGLRAGALATLVGGLFNALPATSLAENVHLAGSTLAQRRACLAGGFLLVALGFVPKFSHLLASVPLSVLGGVAIPIFGLVCVTGLRILGGLDYRAGRSNLIIVAVSVGFGLIPILAPEAFSRIPAILAPTMSSGFLLTMILAVPLNVLLNGFRSYLLRQASPPADPQQGRI